VPWKTVLHDTLIPTVTWRSDYCKALVAVLGTTISPYLFFWQASEEAEEVRITREESPLKRSPIRLSPSFAGSRLTPASAWLYLT